MVKMLKVSPIWHLTSTTIGTTLQCMDTNKPSRTKHADIDSWKANARWEPNKPSPNLTIRPTEEDYKLLAELERKLGVSPSQIIRLGLRALATKEGLTA